MLLLLFSIIAITNFLELSIIVYLKYCVLTCVRNATTLLVGLSHDFRHLEAKKRSRRGNGLHAAMQDAMKYSDSEDESSRLSMLDLKHARAQSSCCLGCIPCPECSATGSLCIPPFKSVARAV